MTTSEILNRSEDSIIPEMAIIVNSVGYRTYYLERRDIVNGKMTAGVPLTTKCLTDIVSTLSSDRTDIIHGAIPANMLYADSRKGFERYVWYREPEKRHVYFKSGLNIPNGEMWVPGLIYSVQGTTLSMYAYKGRRPKDKLFHAPFFNTSEGVCLGSAKVEKPEELTYEAVMQYWEDMFWKSEFTHIWGANPIKGNLALITKQCIESGCRFPEAELLPIRTTLKSIMR